MSFLITKLPVNERVRINEPATLVIPSSWLLRAIDRQYRGPPPLGLKEQFSLQINTDLSENIRELPVEFCFIKCLH